MTSWDDIWKDAAPGMLSSLGGETVTYQESGGRIYSLSALITRQPPSNLPEVSHGIAPAAEMHIQRGTGTDCLQQVRSGDRVCYPAVVGEEPSWHDVEYPPLGDSDAAFWHIRVR